MFHVPVKGTKVDVDSARTLDALEKIACRTREHMSG